ncbi:MAG: vWA domain-containing protein [Pseudonocardia sp.]
MSDLVGVLVGFGRALRRAGVAVGPGDVVGYCAAAATLDPTDLVDLYWAGRTALLARREDIATYDEVFRAYFLGEHQPVRDVLTLAARAEGGVVDVPAAEPPAADAEEGADDDVELGLVGSNVDVLRRKSFASCTPEELAAVRRLMARLRLVPPRRRTRRARPARRRRRPDLRRTVRACLRRHGELTELRWRRRRVKVRPLVLILDVSGSMADHSRALLQFAHSARRAGGTTAGAQRVHVYCFGTRLTCITAPLRHRSPDAALRDAGRLVVDWEGGTRIGASLEQFVRTAGRRGICRGAVVVICSDGLDRGDPATLSAAMERLSRLCHRIVWCHPRLVDGRAPRTMGMMVAEPHVDVLACGHDLDSLAELAALLPRLG